MYHSNIMEKLIMCAENLPLKNDIPIFAMIVIDKNIIAQSSNEVEKNQNPLHHAEFLCIKKALDVVGGKYLDMASLYVNLEPCSFCAAALEKVRIKEIFFGAYDTKSGGIFHNSKIFETSQYKPQTIIGGFQEMRCQNLLKSFFKNLRD